MEETFSFNLVIEVLLISSPVAAASPVLLAQSFNLVIEVLLISRESFSSSACAIALRFQSRNRGSFDFKRITGYLAVLGV